MGGRSGATALTAALAAAVLAVLTACSHSTHGSGQGSISSSPSATATAPPLTKQQADSISAELAAGTDDGLRAAIAMPSGQALDPTAAAGLKAIGPIVLDPATFAPIDGVDATVKGTVAHPPAGESANWTFTLVLQSGTWKLVDMQPS